MINPFIILLNLFNAILQVYIGFLFFSYFSVTQKGKWFNLSALAILSVALTLFLTLSPMGIVRMLLVYSITFFTAFLFKLKWYNYLLLSTLILSTSGISEFIVTVLISFLFSVDAQTATQGAFQVLGIVLSKMMVMLVLAVLKILKYRFSYSLTIKKAFTLLLIPLSTTIISLLHINLFVIFPKQSNTLLYSSLVSYIVLVLSNIIVFHLIDNSYKESEREKKLTAVTELLHAQSEQYEQMQQHNHRVMKMRHDQKNFILGLLSLLESGDAAAAEALLKRELDMLKKPDEYDFNNIVSAVVKTKSDWASSHGVAIDFKYSELHKIQISAVDIAIILGNALDNAIESTQKTEGVDKTIRLIVKINQDLIVIIIKNPTKEPVNTANLISTKRNNGSRGFGIAGIEELTKKYEGEVIFRYEDLTFETNIVMRNVVK